jgi:hypothetical protein
MADAGSPPRMATRQAIHQDVAGEPERHEHVLHQDGAAAKAAASGRPQWQAVNYKRHLDAAGTAACRC